MIKTARLYLRPWRETDRETVAALYSDPKAAQDYGRPLTRAESMPKFEQYLSAFTQFEFTRWCVELHDGRFIGTNGVMRQSAHQCLGDHNEIGWRLLPEFWGKGYATEAAQAALHDAQTRCGLHEILAYTAPDNLPSQAVMGRLGLKRRTDLDFLAHYPAIGDWQGWVWST